MYIPAAFAQQDPTELLHFMQAHSFATLVSQQPFMATHLPVVAGLQTIEGHLAKANPQDLALHGQEVLVLFQGPHAYVRASWYDRPGQVPTWNYTAVHAYGTLQVIDDPEHIQQHLHGLVQQHEHHQTNPWHIDLSPDALLKMARGITVFQVQVRVLEGKQKLSQNRSREERQKVHDGLTEAGETQVAHLMRPLLL